MPEDLVSLSKRIAKLKPNPEAFWFDNADADTGLPNLPPFYIHADHVQYVRTGKWQVCVTTKRDNGHAVLFDDLDGPFAAYRLMVDCFEAWQLIKPIEVVYFIGASLRPGALIKIGHSRDVKARLRNLQTGHGEELHIFATTPGGKELEAKYHRRWSIRRRQGEWFQVGEPIIKEIDRLKAVAS